MYKVIELHFGGIYDDKELFSFFKTHYGEFFHKSVFDEKTNLKILKSFLRKKEFLRDVRDEQIYCEFQYDSGEIYKMLTEFENEIFYNIKGNALTRRELRLVYMRDGELKGSFYYDNQSFEEWLKDLSYENEYRCFFCGKPVSNEKGLHKMLHRGTGKIFRIGETKINVNFDLDFKINLEDKKNKYAHTLCLREFLNVCCIGNEEN